MPLIQRRERDSHWYYPNGEPCHTMTAKSTGLPRPTTLRDARKLGLVPSVTNILSMKAKPALDTWKLDKAILSALTLQRHPGEPDDQFAARIAEDSEQEAAKAAEWGTQIHEQVEHYNLHRSFSTSGEILDYVTGYETWFRANVLTVIAAEQSVVGPGYAGRLDLHAIVNLDGRPRRAIIDLKSQRLKGKADGAFYKEWSMQLAAYAAAAPAEVAEEPPALISLIIPSDRPGSIQPKVWTNYREALDAFHSCQMLWCFDKDYTPPLA